MTACTWEADYIRFTGRRKSRRKLSDIYSFTTPFDFFCNETLLGFAAKKKKKKRKVCKRKPLRRRQINETLLVFKLMIV